jgi:hypothetical protein
VLIGTFQVNLATRPERVKKRRGSGQDRKYEVRPDGRALRWTDVRRRQSCIMMPGAGAAALVTPSTWPRSAVNAAASARAAEPGSAALPVDEQWMLSVPNRLRFLFASRPESLTRAARLADARGVPIGEVELTLPVRYHLVDA